MSRPTTAFLKLSGKSELHDFCLSTFGQMLDNEAVYSQLNISPKKPYRLRPFQRVKGTLEQSEEAFPDESRLDNLRAVRTLKESGFNGLIEVDHAPHLSVTRITAT